MLYRLPATVLAGALVLVPSVRAGLDHAHAPVPAPRRATGDTLRAPAADTVRADRASENAAAAGVGAFGFGPHTSFFPSQEPRELVLSFDDGPDLKFTPIVLSELDRRGLKAVFFVTGHRVVGDHAEDQARRELLSRIAAHGHLVANHTMTHRDLCQAGDVAAREIDENAELITEATGVRPLLFRAPYGSRCRALEAALEARQLVSVGWNLDPQDWRNPSSEEILGYLQERLGRLAGRGILLLHDTHPASVFALGPLLDWIAQENRAAVQNGRPPIVLRDYSVFLPARPAPRTGITSALASLLGTLTDGVAAHLQPAWTASSKPASLSVSPSSPSVSLSSPSASPPSSPSPWAAQ